MANTNASYSDYFRKHKRIVFAVLTLIAIVSFILGDAMTSRGGGPGPGGPGWFEREGEPVAVVEGKTYDERKLGELGQQRFFTRTYVEAVQKLGALQLIQQLGYTPPEAATLLEGLGLYNMVRRQGGNPAQYFRPETLALFARWEESVKSERFKTLTESQQQSLSSGYLQATNGEEFLSPLGLVDFLYWKKRADELGVVMPPNYVIKDLLNLGLGLIQEQDLQQLRANLRRERPLMMDELLAALGDELRAMIARDIVQGNGQSMFMQGKPMDKMAQVTPLDMWNSYAALNTRLDVSILPLPVSNKDFISKVKDPTKEELKAFFDKYKSILPDKDSPKPGFKIPKQHRLEFVHGNLRVAQPARKYYEKWAEAMEALNPQLAQVALVAEYERRKNEFKLFEVSEDFPMGTGAERKFARLGNWSSLRAEPRFVSQVAAAVAAEMSHPVAGFMGGGYLLQPGFSMVSGREEAVIAAAQAAGQAVASGFNWVSPPVPGMARRILVKERDRPFAEVAAMIKLDLVENQCRDWLSGEINDLKKALEEYGKKYAAARGKWRALRATDRPTFTPPLFDDAKKQTLADYLQEFAKKRGLTYGGMKELRTKEDLFDESGPEKPLNTYVYPIFAQAFVQMPEAELQQRVAEVLTSSRTKQFELMPFQKPEPGSPNKWFEAAYTWKAEQTDERVPTFEEAEPRVRTVWLMEQARPFAEAEAEKLAAEVAKQPDGFKLLMDRPNFKPNEQVARYRLALNQGAATAINYEKAPVPVMEKPPENFVTQALAKLQKPGDHVVVWNKPQTTAYLVILKQREEPKADDAKAREQFDFKIMVGGAMRQPLVDGRPFSDFVHDEKAKQMETGWTQYLKEHTKYNDKLAEKLGESLKNLAKG